jgi:hypothetical protein
VSTKAPKAASRYSCHAGLFFASAITFFASSAYKAGAKIEKAELSMLQVQMQELRLNANAVSGEHGLDMRAFSQKCFPRQTNGRDKGELHDIS